MKYLFSLLIIVTTFSLSGCSSGVHTENLEYDKVTQMWIDKEGKPFTGTLYNTYAGSSIKELDARCKNGKIEGYLTYYYKNGKKKWQVPMRNGGIDGETIYYDPNGNKITEQEFDKIQNR